MRDPLEYHSATCYFDEGEYSLWIDGPNSKGWRPLLRWTESEASSLRCLMLLHYAWARLTGLKHPDWLQLDSMAEEAKREGVSRERWPDLWEHAGNCEWVELEGGGT